MEHAKTQLEGLARGLTKDYYTADLLPAIRLFDEAVAQDDLEGMADAYQEMCGIVDEKSMSKEQRAFQGQFKRVLGKRKLKDLSAKEKKALFAKVGKEWAENPANEGTYDYDEIVEWLEEDTFGQMGAGPSKPYTPWQKKSKTVGRPFWLLRRGAGNETFDEDQWPKPDRSPGWVDGLAWHESSDNYGDLTEQPLPDAGKKWVVNPKGVIKMHPIDDDPPDGWVDGLVWHESVEESTLSDWLDPESWS